VSWQDLRDGNNEIYFARLSSDGVKIGAYLRVTNDPNRSWYSSLSWTGSEYGLSWNRSGEIYFAWLSASGVKIGSDLRVTSDQNESYDPSLSWTGTEFGVIWNEYSVDHYEIYRDNVLIRNRSIISYQDTELTISLSSEAFVLPNSNRKPQVHQNQCPL
jgi:hypothetical protein